MSVSDMILCHVCGHDIDMHDLGECCDCPGSGRGCHQWTSDIARAYAEERVLEVRKAKAKAWDEGAEAAWVRSAPEVNGQTHYWRYEGEPLNPYRQVLGKDTNSTRRTK